MFRIPSNFKSSEYVSVRPADNLSLTDAQTLVRISQAFGLGAPEISIGQLSGAHLTPADYLQQGGDPELPIMTHIRYEGTPESDDGTLCAVLAAACNSGDGYTVFKAFSEAKNPSQPVGGELAEAIRVVPGLAQEFDEYLDGVLDAFS